MGRAKDEGIRWDGLVEVMTNLAVRAGSMERCPHGTALDLLDNEPAFALAAEEFENGKLSEFRDLGEVKAALKAAFDNAGDECTACQKIKDE